NVVKAAVSPAYFVPEGIYADVLFRQMKQTGNHLAVVLDEYGGMMGIVTMYDLLEQLVGELEEEPADCPSEPEIQKLSPDTWKIRGCASIEEVEEAIGISLSEEEADTFGGFVFAKYGCVPQDGSSFEVKIGSLHIKVVKIRDHRLVEAIVSLNKDSSIGKCS
ncbi:MAG: transporter associated domain-containing protein, partial [Clostridiales bacterium]|nr:transporter associated domain-containing protein [Clostridiales bacterium]